MNAPLAHAIFAVPGDLNARTGGYGYARRVLAEARRAGLLLHHWPLPGGFPHASPERVAETLERLHRAPAGWPLLIDGLAYGALPADALAAINAPLIALCHHPLGLETGLDAGRAAALIASERAALGEAGAVITTSRRTAETLAKDFAVPTGKLHIAPPGTDPAPQAAGSGAAEPALLTVGALSPRKGHDVLIAALAALADLPWRLTIVGPPADPHTAGALAAQIAEAGLSERVHLAGPADDDALAAAYDGADLFVLASRYEGYGMAFTEAMAHGLPVVGCDTGAVAEATRGAALLVPPDAPGALSKALRPLIEGAEARAALGAACRDAARGLPRWHDTAAAVAAAVAGVIAKAS